MEHKEGHLKYFHKRNAVGETAFRFLQSHTCTVQISSSKHPFKHCAHQLIHTVISADNILEHKKSEVGFQHTESSKWLLLTFLSSQ